ncbi:glycosyltransferase family 4 protein [Mycobacterium neglectum]|uniref:glycosyltransferase family 4 protein n=1 Tax=Mycobacterium neglectum TaxID=242737 RepID=UPI00159BC090|nr:glycosyltransferase family 4 protein [Mycobacterium neglectum]
MGGLERAVHSLSVGLVERGIQTTVATLSRPDSVPAEEIDGVEIRRLDGFTRHLRRFAADPQHFFHPTCPDPQLVKRLSELIDEIRPDVIHAHGWILNSCMAIRRPTHTPLVATLHDYSAVCAKKTLINHDRLDEACDGPQLGRCLSCAGDYYGKIKGSALTLGLSESRRRMDRVTLFLPISTVVAAKSLSHIPDDRVDVIPSFIDDSAPRDALSTPRPGFLPDGDFLVFVGALGEHKGVELLAEAHRRMKTALPLVIIGAVRADTRIPQGSENRPIFVHTGLPHNEIMATLAAATAAVTPSRWQEPLGLVPIEAMAAGTPVVATRVGALPEVVKHEQTGLVVEPNNPDALAAALDRIVTDRRLRDDCGRAGRRWAQRFTASAVIPRVIDAYERAIGASDVRALRHAPDRSRTA